MFTLIRNANAGQADSLLVRLKRGRHCRVIRLGVWHPEEDGVRVGKRKYINITHVLQKMDVHSTPQYFGTVCEPQIK